VAFNRPRVLMQLRRLVNERATVEDARALAST
jgi:hypothetical protein